jgi:hypothetical protein
MQDFANFDTVGSILIGDNVDHHSEREMAVIPTTSNPP